MSPQSAEAKQRAAETRRKRRQLEWEKNLRAKERAAKQAEAEALHKKRLAESETLRKQHRAEAHRHQQVQVLRASGGNLAAGFFVAALFIRAFGLGAVSALYVTLAEKEKPGQETTETDPENPAITRPKKNVVDWGEAFDDMIPFLLTDGFMALTVGAVEWLQPGAGKSYAALLLLIMTMADWRQIEPQLNRIFHYRKKTPAEAERALEGVRSKQSAQISISPQMDWLQHYAELRRGITFPPKSPTGGHQRGFG